MKNRREPPEKGLVCTDWGKQSLPAVERHCYMCDKPVAVTANNVASALEMGLEPVCLECTLSTSKGRALDVRGALVGGKQEDTLEGALKAVADEIRQQRRGKKEDT
jgi:hypothetical protein